MFTNDYAAALERAIALDQKIMGDAARVQSSQYADIVSLATRQTMGALDFTIGTDSSGNIVPGDVMIFMKNLGTDRFVSLYIVRVNQPLLTYLYPIAASTL